MMSRFKSGLWVFIAIACFICIPDHSVTAQNRGPKNVQVALRAKWSGTSLLLEAGELLSKEWKDLFWDFTEFWLLSSDDNSNFTAKNCLEKVVDYGKSVLSESLASLFEFSLTLRSTSPRLVLYRQLAEDSLSSFPLADEVISDIVNESEFDPNDKIKKKKSEPLLLGINPRAPNGKCYWVDLTLRYFLTFYRFNHGSKVPTVCMRNTRGDEDAELVELQESLRREALKVAKNKNLPVPVEVAPQPAAPRKRRPSDKDKEVATSPKRRHKRGSAREARPAGGPVLAKPVSAAKGSRGVLKEVVGPIADPSRKKQTCDPIKAVEQAGKILSEAATVISQLANTCEESKSSSLAEAKRWHDSFDEAMAEVAILKKRLAGMESREATLVKDLEDRSTEVVTLKERVIEAELAAGKATRKMDEAMEMVSGLEIDLDLAIVEAVTEYKKTDEYLEATNVAPYFDAGASDA